MNRSIALFVALAVLVAHSLAIHTDGSATLAPPYDLAYVAFRIGQNVAHEGTLSWVQGLDAFDSYPSLLWIAVCAAAEYVWWVPINLFTQMLGMAAAMSTLVLASRFHPDRIASLIAPFLLAISGCVAAAAVSGTETALLMCCATTAFLAFERRWSTPLALALVLCGLTRPEGWLFAAAMFALRALQAVRQADLRRELTAFIAPGAAFVLVALWRLEHTGHALSAYSQALATLDEGELAGGLAYLADFFVTAASPALVAYAIWYLLRGRLSPTGARALLLFVLWSALIVAQGGGTMPFSISILPALPLGLIAAQEGMITALNSTRRWVRGVAWAGFLGAVSMSALASRGPADMGPIPLGELQAALMEPRFPPRYGYADRLGRAGLEEEIERTRTLRHIGIFMRENLDPAHSVLTPWPGSIAYLSRLSVLDLQGRTDPGAPGERQRPWSGRHRVDVLRALERRPDYVVPFLEPPARTPSEQDLASTWIHELDDRQPSESRAAQLAAALGEYELIAVPLSGGARREGKRQRSREPAFLLRRRALGLAPVVELVVDGEELAVLLSHHGHEQLATLLVWEAAGDGAQRFLDPTGRFVQAAAVQARTDLLVVPTGERPIELIRARLPAREGPVTLHAVLRNPGAKGTQRYAMASAEAALSLQ